MNAPVIDPPPPAPHIRAMTRPMTTREAEARAPATACALPRHARPAQPRPSATNPMRRLRSCALSALLACAAILAIAAEGARASGTEGAMQPRAVLSPGPDAPQGPEADTETQAETGSGSAPGAPNLDAPDAPFPSYEAVMREGASVPLENWRALTDGRTVWYYFPEGLWGREAYRGLGGAEAEGAVVFEHRSGACLSGDWRYLAEAELYCFDFQDGRTHCFRHLRWQERLFAVSLSGDVQEVKRIDGAALTCGPAPMS